MAENFELMLDIDALGVELGGESREIPGPGGKMMTQVTWTPELVKKLCERIKGLSAGKRKICHTGSAPLWVMAAAVNAMGSADIIFAPPVPDVYLTVHHLPQGDFDPAGEVEFNVERKGHTVYITYKSDDPNKPQLFGGGHHSYDPALLPNVKAPLVTPEDTVCLTGNGSYNVTLSIATAYFKSAALAIKGALGDKSGSYICAITNSPSVNVGDVIE